MSISGKHPSLIIRQEDPLNVGPPPELLGRSAVTPTDLFFVRNHGTPPLIDPVRYRLSVDGLVRRPLSLSLDALRGRFVEVAQEATLQCAGNRRRELTRVTPIPGELEWDLEAIGNAVWRGIRLRDVLEAAGVDDRARHVAVRGLDEVRHKGRVSGYGGSIPLAKAVSPEVILAYEMNGEPLPPLHGFPLRIVVPGYIGARSVKWLAGITLQAEPSDNYYQTHAYKIFPSHISAENVDWERGVMLGEFPVNAAILSPRDGERVSAGQLTLRGYALSGGRNIARLDVSLDGGETWRTAVLRQGGSAWTWRLWDLQLPLDPGTYHVAVRAWDATGETQPEDPATIWNFKGYANNAWHRITIHTG